MMRELKPSKKADFAARAAVIAGLCLIACLLAYFTFGELEDTATAEPATSWGNAGQQRKDLLEAQRQTNEKLDEIIKLLTSGKVRVQTVGDESGGRHEVTTKPAGS